MRTNKEKYMYYYNLLEERAQAFIKEVIPVKPDRFFEISPKYEAMELFIYSIGYQWKYPNNMGSIYKRDRPTRLMVNDIKVFYESNPSCEKDNIFFYL
jgi:hypothetical protein